MAERTQPDARELLHKLERRDWSLWFTDIIILVLLCSAVFFFSVPLAWHRQQFLSLEELDISIRALFGLVLLFSTFVVYQQHLIKQFRARLTAQIMELAELEGRTEEFYRLSTTDALTGLFNRRFAMEQLPREVARAERYGHPLTLLMLDLDDFKVLNDHYGHGLGDAVLQRFAYWLKSALRVSDLAIRLGGDEFMVVLPECSADQAEQFLKRIPNCILEVECETIAVQYSAGIAQYLPGESVGQMLERGDQALYQNKRERRSGRPMQKVRTHSALASH